MMGAGIKNAREFFEKYDLGPSLDTRIDKDLTKEGVQNDSVNLDQLVNDYNDLSSDEKYAVFVRLEKGGDSELLKKITNFEKRSGPFDKPTVYLDKAFSEVIKDTELRINSSKNIWDKRLNVAEGLFVIDQLLAGLGETGMSDALKIHIAAQLTLLYSKEWPKVGSNSKGNPIFDTDGDFNPYEKKKLRVNAFDDKDPLPLDSKYSSDRDKDGVPNELDIKPDDPSQWTHLKIGGSADGSNYQVKRVSKDKFVISRTFTVGADPKGNVENIKKTLLSDTELTERARVIEEAFNKAVEKGKYKFALKIEFKAVDNGEEADIMFTDRNIRSHSRLWGGNLIFSPKDMLHEVFHLFGEPDYYYEPNVHAGYRDFTTKPGYSMLAANHLMRCADEPMIPQNLLLKLVTETFISETPATSDEDRNYERVKTFLDLVPYELDGKHIITGDEDPGIAKKMAQLESDIPKENDPKKKDAMLFAKAVGLFMTGRKEEASTLMMEVYNRNKNDEVLTYRMLGLLKMAGDFNNALIISNYNVEKRGSESDKYYHAGILLESGRTKEAFEYADSLINKVGKNYTGSVRKLWLKCLIALGRYDDVTAFIESQPDGIDRTFHIYNAVELYLEAKDIKNAQNIYSRYNDNPDRYRMFMHQMRMAGFKKESTEWFLKNIFPTLDIRNDSDFLTLRNEADWFKNNGFAKESVPLYEAVLKRDPFNVNVNLSYSMAIYSSGNNEQAFTALNNTLRAYDYMEERGLTTDMTLDDFVRSIAYEIKKFGYEAQFNESFEKSARDHYFSQEYRKRAVLCLVFEELNK